MISEFIDRQATNEDLFELEDVETGQKKQYRIVSKATVTQPGTNLNKATFDPILEEIDGKLSESGGVLKGDLVPYTSSINLGSAAGRWQTVFANTINASNGGFTNLMVSSQNVWHAGNLQIAIGTVSITPSTATTPASQVVSFGKTFSAPPKVILTATNSENAHVFSWSTSNITTTQFTASVSNSAGAYPSYANWVAIGI